MKSEKTQKCRSCQNSLFVPIFDFGSQVIANHFHYPDTPPCQPFPLSLVRCHKCSLVQLEYSTDVDLMYRNYWYQSGINQSMRDHLQGLANQTSRLVNLKPSDAVVDIGCNDGTFLSYFPSSMKRIGVDPSNIKPTVPCEYVNDYFTYESVNKALQGKKAKLVSSIAMFYDLNNPASFVMDIRKILADDGLWVVELSYLPIMIRNVAYDSVCHEHVAYYRMGTFMDVIKKTDLVPIYVNLNQMNGGSFRVFLSPKGHQSEMVDKLIQEEEAEGYATSTPYDKFSEGVKKSSGQLSRFFDDQKGKIIYGYGASTKGQVIMQYCQIGSDKIIAIAERNPLKYGLYTPGTNVRICSEEEMRMASPDFLVIFPWYFLQEFNQRESNLYVRGTKFVVPLPSFSII